jgi:hypothetical protein
MEEQAYVGELIAALVYLYAGIRLLRLSSRTGEVPERLLAAMFFVTGTSLLLYGLAVILDSESLWTPLNFAGRVAYLPAPVLLAAFTRRVFHPESVWTTWMACGCAILLIGGVGGSVWGGDLEGFSIGNPWFWAEWTGYTIPFAWAGVEALAHHRRALRRVQLGLCDPLVCNRYWLWGFFGAMQVLVSVAVILQYSEYEQESAFSTTWDALISTGEISSLALIWLVFFPPAFYRRWIQSFAPAATADKG